MMHIDEIDYSLLKRALQALGFDLEIYLDEDKHCTRRTRAYISCRRKGEIFCGLVLDGFICNPHQLGVLIDYVLKDRRCTEFLISKDTPPLLEHIKNPFPDLPCDEAIEIYIDTIGM